MHSNHKYTHRLIFNDFKLPVYLGVTAKERARKQNVLITVKISFMRPPRACETGNINDTICYDALIQKIKQFCHNQKFTLLELLGEQLFILIKNSIFKESKLYLHLAKLRPLKDLAQSAFEIAE